MSGFCYPYTCTATGTDLLAQLAVQLVRSVPSCPLSHTLPALGCRPYDLDDAMHRRIQLAFEFRWVLPTSSLEGAATYSVITFTQNASLLLPSALA